jgi:hypothetical protein
MIGFKPFTTLNIDILPIKSNKTAIPNAINSSVIDSSKNIEIIINRTDTIFVLGSIR